MSSGNNGNLISNDILKLKKVRIMSQQYIAALGVKVIIKEEEVNVTDFHTDPIHTKNTLTIKCKCGETLTIPRVVLFMKGRECGKCKRLYIGEHP